LIDLKIRQTNEKASAVQTMPRMSHPSQVQKGWQVHEKEILMGLWAVVFLGLIAIFIFFRETSQPFK
jgi:hypothetical protein